MVVKSKKSVKRSKRNIRKRSVKRKRSLKRSKKQKGGRLGWRDWANINLAKRGWRKWTKENALTEAEDNIDEIKQKKLEPEKDAEYWENDAQSSNSDSRTASSFVLRAKRIEHDKELDKWLENMKTAVNKDEVNTNEVKELLDMMGRDGSLQKGYHNVFELSYFSGLKKLYL